VFYRISKQHPRRVLLEMQHAPDSDCIRGLVPNEINAVRKTPRARETVWADALAKKLRCASQFRELCFHGLKKRETKPLAALLIPVEKCQQMMSFSSIQFFSWMVSSKIKQASSVSTRLTMGFTSFQRDALRNNRWRKQLHQKQNPPNQPRIARIARIHTRTTMPLSVKSVQSVV